VGKNAARVEKEEEIKSAESTLVHDQIGKGRKER